MSSDYKQYQASIWLEVANVRFKGTGVDIQVKGDRADREPVWWEVNSVKAGFGKEEKRDVRGKVTQAGEQGHDAAYRAIAEGLDKKRTVLANLVYDTGTNTLKCEIIRVQYAESNSR